MILIAPFNDTDALPIFRALDPNDHIEADLMRGVTTTGFQLWADWRAADNWRVMSMMAFTGPSKTTPFAVFGLSNTGQAGIASAALLARDHRQYHIPLARLASAIRAKLPSEAGARGIRRIEARAWTWHPTASRLLTALGFEHEADMAGFGPDGSQTYRQFSLLIPPIMKGP